MKIKVIIKEPDKTATFKEIENSLEELQQIVGGYIETVTIATDMCIICDEEGCLKGLPYNCNVFGVDFVGTIIFVGVSGEEFCDVPIDEEMFEKNFGRLYKEGGKG